MTIKEIEELSGIARANIRYYETEGLLTPFRAENGYRDYSPADLRTLQRIRLLRSLGMSLDEIKAVQSGRVTLSASLYQLEQQLEDTRERLDWATETCRILRQDNVTYESLDAARYFNRLPPAAPQETPAEPPFRGPWRRYFARLLDVEFCYTVIVAVVSLLLHLRPQIISELNLVWQLLAVVALGLLEPLLLCKFGTTPGKWLLGLHITDLDGNRPDYHTAKNRTWGALFWGLGLNFPIFSLVRLWKSYHGCVDGDTLPWEYETDQFLRSRKPWKDGAAVGAFAVLIAILLVAVLSNDTVPHKGDLTANGFCENYNALLDYYDDGGLYLHPNGKFDRNGYKKDGVYVVQGDDIEERVAFVHKDGVLKSVTLTSTTQGGIVFDQDFQIMITVLAAVKTRVSALSFAGENFIRQMMRSPFGDFQGTVRGITVTRDWEYTGYRKYSGIAHLSPEDKNAVAVMTLTVEFG